MPRTPRSTLFPYTTLFRSDVGARQAELRQAASVLDLAERSLKREEALVATGASTGQLLDDARARRDQARSRSEEHTSELQSHHDLVCRLLLEKKKRKPAVQ